MRSLSAFTQMTLDGYFTGADGDLGWAYRQTDDREWDEYVAGNASAGGVLIFGRKTYEMMAGYWPTPAAARDQPAVAKGMNAMRKYVFSRTLKKAGWENTTVLAGDPAAEMRRLKGEAGPDMVILGSGSIIAQLTGERLIDSYQVVINPVALGGGRTIFEGIGSPLRLKRVRSRVFDNGNVVLWYEPGA